MSSKRGRKRNDNLPPNRARDVQRAFRARRAAHLAALEKRVEDLEDENVRLRAALGLPPANRPPLGKGPTGKDRPKQDEDPQSQPDVTSLVSSASPHDAPHPPMSRTQSPLSTGSTSGQSQSMSPDPIGPGVALPQTSPGLDWNESMFADKSSDNSLSSSTYSLPRASTLTTPFPHVPRSTGHDMYPSSHSYPQADEKFGYILDEDRRFDYSYSLLSGPPAQSHLPPSLPSGGDATFLQRRTEPDSFRPLLSQVPSPTNIHNAHTSRVSSTPLNVDTGFDVAGGAERRFPRLH